MEARFFLGVLSLVVLYGVANGYQCHERPRKLGCFQDSRNNRLMTHASTVKMKSSDWVGDNWNEHLDKLLCECSKEAKKKLKLYFGLQHYYECWVGNLDNVDFETRRLHDNSKCWSKNPHPFTCEMNDQVCVGTPFTMTIYEVKHSSYAIPDTKEPTIKVMTIPKKGKKPPPFIPVPPHLGRR